jgi:NitT/TauT family transport system permease protein
MEQQAAEAVLSPALAGSGRGQRVPRALRGVVAFLAVLVVLAALWEGYKLLGDATGGVIPLTSINLPVRPDDRSMPHTWEMVTTLFEPARRGEGQDILLVLLGRAGVITFREALVGFLLGSAAGFGIGVLFARSRLFERGLMPYVVASQTVPLIAIAPMVVIWGSRIGWPSWLSVSLIAAYLSFFPVAINTLRGLRSPEATAMELLKSYAASPRQVLWKLQVPAALPYIFTALKVAATASVVGAIIGELPAGLPDGLGRQLLTFSYYYITGPPKLYASIIVSALLGIVFVGLIALIEHVVVGQRMGSAPRT